MESRSQKVREADRGSLESQQNQGQWRPQRPRSIWAVGVRPPPSQAPKLGRVR